MAEVFLMVSSFICMVIVRSFMCIDILPKSYNIQYAYVVNNNILRQYVTRIIVMIKTLIFKI